MTSPSSSALSTHWVSSKQAIIAILTLIAIVVHLVLRLATDLPAWVDNIPLWAAYLFGGVPLVWDLLRKMLRGEFGSDFLAGLSIVTSVILSEYLAGVLVILMLSGGEALEAYAAAEKASGFDPRAGWAGNRP